MSRPKRRPRLPSTVLPLTAPRPPRLLSSAAPIPPPRRPPPKSPASSSPPPSSSSSGVVFGRMTRPVTLVLELDDTPCRRSWQGFIGEMVALSNGKLNSVAVDAAGVITAEDGSSAPTSLTVGEPLAVTLPDGAELPVYGSLDDSGRAQFDVAGVLPSARPVVRMWRAGREFRRRYVAVHRLGLPRCTVRSRVQFVRARPVQRRGSGRAVWTMTSRLAPRPLTRRST